MSLGRIRNDIGVKLADAEVVVASGEASEQLGVIGTGRSVPFELTVSPSSDPWAQAFGAPAPIVSDNPGTSPSSTSTGAGGSSPLRARLTSTTVRGQERSTAAAAEAKRATSQIEAAMGDLAASYSTQQGGAPVFVAMAAHKLFPSDARAGANRPVVTDVLVVPLSPAEGRQVKRCPSSQENWSGRQVSPVRPSTPSRPVR